MKIGTSTTTPSAAAAGTAFGSMVGAGLAALTGLEPALTVGGCGVCGAFAFGRLFGDK